MCGIFGCLGVAADVEMAVAELRHRGPDDTGIHRSPADCLVLAHTRLSILDLTQAGHQPMERSFRGRETYITVYNGEIYNFRELRIELAAKGHVLTTECDTEVLLAAYAEWGADCVHRFRGMFAFAIWDQRRRSLLLGRDRFGIKPLYYAAVGDGIVFGSEVRAILHAARLPREVNREAVWGYLDYGAVHPPSTIVKGIQCFPPGSIAWCKPRYPAGPVEINIQRYWDIHSATATKRHELQDVSYDDAVNELHARLRAATAIHSIADVPVGAFLSGGVDSSLLVGLMTEALGRRINTFSVGFADGEGYANELHFARIAAARFGCEHQELIINGRDVGAAWPRIIEQIDQPSIDGLNTWFVAGAARTGLKVALSGLGSDELFAGYAHFRRLRDTAWLSGVAQSHRLIPPLIKVAPRRLRARLQWWLTKADARYGLVRRLNTEREKEKIFSSAWRHECRPVPVAASALNGSDIVRETSYAEVTGYLHDTLLRDADAMSMAHGLEVRPVLLDHELAEYVYSLPSEYKLRGGTGKAVLIDACASILPPEIVMRPKQGFNLPLERWLRAEMRPIAEEVLSNESAQTIFSGWWLDTMRTSLAKSRGAEVWPTFSLIAYMKQLRLAA
jgi:asparagine synthase (glutamine-hydrolysing)